MVYLGIAASLVAILVAVVVAARFRDPHACARGGWTSRLRTLLDRDRDLVHAVNDKGETPLRQAVWYDEVEPLTLQGFRARVQSTPVQHQGPFEREQRHGIEDLVDWQVEQHDGTIRGGYSHQVLFLRTREKLGRLPRELAQHEHRFIDHDLPALLREANSANVRESKG